MTVLSDTGIRAGASAASGSGGYEIEKSLRFDQDDGAYLTRTPSSTGDTKKFTYSGWVKKCDHDGDTHYLLAAISGGNVFIIGFETDFFYVYNPAGVIYSAQKLRDPSAWYHLVVAVDTDQTTDTDRVKMWVNNVRVTEYNSATHPAQAATTVFNTSAVPMTIGKYSSALGGNFYIAEVHYLDGEQLDPSSFGKTDSTTGQWVPKKYSGDTASYGTNGFYLKFNDVYDDNGTVKVPDNSGNDNEFEAINIIPDQLATVSAATGGLPIYNTSGDYGGTKESGYRTDSSAGTTDGTGLVLAIPGDTTTDVHAGINTGSSNKTLSTSGTVSTTTDVSKFYGTSIDLTTGTSYGTTHYWSIAASSDFAFGTGDYTVEWWQYWNDPAGYQSVFCNGYTDSGALLFQSVNNEAKWYVYVAGSSIITESTAATVKVWTHYALVRNGTTVTLYRNGAISGSVTNSVSTGLSDHNFLIGRDESGYAFNGYIQDFRVYKGVAKYTSTFTVPQPETLKQDVSNDVPTTFEGTGNGNGNYATWNPLDKGAALTLSQGNLRIASAPNDFVRATIGMKSGKWYYEEKVGIGDHMIGIADRKADNNYYLGQSHSNGHVAFGWYKTNGAIYYYVDTSDYTVTTNSLGTYTTGDVVGVAFDADNGALYFSKNGTWVNSATKAEIAAGTTTNAVVTGCNAGPYFFAAGLDATTADHYANFGQRGWAFPDSVPDGFKALNTYNLPDPVITDPSKYFDTLLYTGDNSASERTITGLNFEPDMTWVKTRSVATQHMLWDAVRGSNLNLVPNETQQEYGLSSLAQGAITGSASDGIKVSPGSSGADFVNESAVTYVSWNWDGGTANATNDASETSIGSIDSTYRANPSAGFSIVTYTGTGSNGTVAHGLNATPNFIIIKNRDATSSWPIYHSAWGIGSYGVLNDNVAWSATSASYIYNTDPTSTVFGIGAGDWVNTLDAEYVAYVWSEVEGYSKFGNYLGNEDADGPFLYCGFKPAWLWIKNSEAVADPQQYDNARETYNIMDHVLFTNGDGIETQGAGYSLDFLSNGFKIRNAYGNFNGAQKMVFAAFAESPFKYANAL